MESCLLPAATWDFSENNLANLHGFDSSYGAGRNSFMSLAYLARWSGPVNEADDPHSNGANSPAGLKVRKHVQTAQWIPDRSGPADNTRLKQAIMAHGGLYSTFFWGNNYYNSANAAYRPLAGFFDDDWKADPTIYNSTLGRWYIALSTRNHYWAYLDWYMGSSCLPVCADFDGDGYADPAFYSPSSHNWYILLSFFFEFFAGRVYSASFICCLIPGVSALRFAVSVEHFCLTGPGTAP